MALTYSSRSAGAPEAAWDLFARPERWREWSPHLRGARGLGAPEVEPGRSGWVEVLGLPLVPVTITQKEPGRSWSWRVGPVDMDHRVVPVDGGCRVELVMQAPLAVEAALRVTYGPLVAVLVRNLARVAATSRSSSGP